MVESQKKRLNPARAAATLSQLRQWVVLDAKSEPLGRLSVKIAKILVGKNKVSFLPNLDEGDEVVVINASALVTTGKKLTRKFYYRYSGYPGGLTKESLGHLKNRRPAEVIRHAVSGMLPKNKLLKRRLARLHIYSGLEHPHEGQLSSSV